MCMPLHMLKRELTNIYNMEWWEKWRGSEQKLGIIGSGVIRNDIEKDILKHFSTTPQSQLGKLKTTDI